MCCCLCVGTATDVGDETAGDDSWVARVFGGCFQARGRTSNIVGGRDLGMSGRIRSDIKIKVGAAWRRGKNESCTYEARMY